MNLLEKMLAVETQARQMIEQAQAEANEIRRKARKDAQQLIIDGRENIHARLQQEIAQLEQEAHTQKESILKAAEQQLALMEQQAQEHTAQAVEQVVQMLLNPSEYLSG